MFDFMILLRDVTTVVENRFAGGLIGVLFIFWGSVIRILLIYTHTKVSGGNMTSQILFWNYIEQFNTTVAVKCTSRFLNKKNN